MHNTLADDVSVFDLAGELGLGGVEEGESFGGEDVEDDAAAVDVGGGGEGVVEAFGGHVEEGAHGGGGLGLRVG